MKTKEFTVEKALWWARGLLVTEDKNKPNVSCMICPLKAEDALTTPFCEDAPISAVTALARIDHKLSIIGKPHEQYDDMDMFDMVQHQAAADARGCI